MRSGRWLISAVLVVLIGLFAFLGYLGNRQTDTGRSGGVLEFGAEDVRRLEVRTADSRLLLRREQTTWMLEQPIQWSANPFNVEHLLQLTDAHSDSSFAAEGRDLAQFGLEQPIGELLLNDSLVVFGVNHSIGERRYTRIGPTIHLLPDVYIPFMMQGIQALVDRRLLPPPLALQSLRLAKLELTRDDGRQWRAANHPQATRGWVEQRVANWQNLEASRIRPLDQSAAPRQSVQARLESGTTLEFQILSLAPEIIIAHLRLGLQFHFPEDHYQQLLSTPDDVAS